MNIEHVVRDAPPAASRLQMGTWLKPVTAINVLVVSLAVSAAIAAVVLLSAGGWDYYRTPMRVRAYAPAHRLLRPSGLVGQTLGVAGMAMMTMPLLYALRKKWRRLSRFGSMKRWLDVHIFCGIVGPVLVTFHAAMKFNGLISVAYWSMVAVMLSGFVGRYLYVRIPRSIRGAELSRDEIALQAAALQTRLAAGGLSRALLDRIDAVSRPDVAEGGLGLVRAYLWEPLRERRRFASVSRDLGAAGFDADHTREVLRLASERTWLLRRLASLETTRRWFAMWHVFHQPLVYLMFGIALLHIGLAVYFGYTLFPKG